MVRKQLYLEPRQNQRLKRLARERGVTEAEVVREALEQYAASPQSPAAAQSWAAEIAFMKALQAQGPLPQKARDWKREDLYEERLSRYGRRNPG